MRDRERERKRRSHTHKNEMRINAKYTSYYKIDQYKLSTIQTHFKHRLYFMFPIFPSLIAFSSCFADGLDSHMQTKPRYLSRGEKKMIERCMLDQMLKMPLQSSTSMSHILYICNQRPY